MTERSQRNRKSETRNSKLDVPSSSELQVSNFQFPLSSASCLLTLWYIILFSKFNQRKGFKSYG